MSQLDELLSLSTVVGEKVRDFYDHHPYPPPLDNLDDYRHHWQDLLRRRADFHLFWPWRVYQEEQSILVAGCGTSQAAKHAIRWPMAQVTGIDCSETSVRHTERLKKQHGLKNLQVHQLAIEQASELGMSFDQIVCTGVLHHLADPEAGLNALRSMLKPDGAMHLMVYARYGRTGIYMLQEFCRRTGIRTTDEEISDLLRVLGALPAGHPLESLLSHAPELINKDGVADSLLHPQDRAYSVPQLFDLIENSGLKFGRWLRQAPYSILCGVMQAIPQRRKIACLPLREQFAVIELFRGTMTRHSAIVYHRDDDASQLFGSSADDWLDYVPIRMPDTACIQERLPRDAAAVLVNRTHTYKDLVLPITLIEKHLVDAIDGRLTIAAIAARTLPGTDCDSYNYALRNFFERLWWHDQVVFASRDAH
jgi:SAM-dependent methyltransferase